MSVQEAKYIPLMPKEESTNLQNFLVSPMAGMLLSVAVKEGQSVCLLYYVHLYFS
jgi:biotin carboxyl carrier protein